MTRLTSFDQHPRQSGDTQPLPTLRFVGPWKTIRPVERQVLHDVYRTRQTASSDLRELAVLAVMILIAVVTIAVTLAIAEALLQRMA